jgi:uncharacterized RDD family membrane protein YckC
MKYASFLSRFFALLVDQIAMVVLAFLATLLLAGLFSISVSTDSGFLGLLFGTSALILLVVLFVFQFVYFGYFWSKSGQSIGMKLFNIEVIRRSEGQGISFWRAGFRGTLGYYISSLIFSLGYLWALIDEHKEAWHDKIFDTWVVVS